MFHRLIRVSIHDKPAAIMWIESKDDDSIGSGIDHATSIADSSKARKHEALQIQRKLDSSLETVLFPLLSLFFLPPFGTLEFKESILQSSADPMERGPGQKNRVSELGRYTSIGKPSATDGADVTAIQCDTRTRTCMYVIYVYTYARLRQSRDLSLASIQQLCPIEMPPVTDRRHHRR